MTDSLFADFFYEGSFRYFIVFMIVGLYCLHRQMNRVDPDGHATGTVARGFFSWLFGNIK